LFQSFSQADASDSRKYGGTGLGLVIAKRLAEMMEGQAGLQSELGKGSTFWFTASLFVGSQELDPSPLLPALAGKRVLLRESHAISRQILEQHLRYCGMTVTCAESDPGGAFDLVLCEANVPQFAARASGIPVIFLTAQRESAGPAALLKPVRRARLIEAMADALHARKENPRPLPSQPAATAWEPKRGRVLVVEDNVVNQRVAQGMLERLGLTVQLASSGLEALQDIRQNHYDMIFMDCQMPEMDGFAATREIRRLQHPAHTPIIALTANVFKDERARCLAAGMDDYLSKPVRRDALMEKLSLWLTPQTVTKSHTNGG
jgi:CheY-like chemotaxis protein